MGDARGGGALGDVPIVGQRGVTVTLAAQRERLVLDNYQTYFDATVDALQIDAYVRVSQIRGRGGESFISPTSQREQIAAWAKSKGHRVAKVHEELDASGVTIERPKLAEAIRRVEAGETGGIAVVKLDRFGRTLVDSLGLIERIQRAGGTFASVQEGFDLTTPTGRLVLRMMLSLAEWELDRIRGNWEEARERAVARGLHLTATVPFGYQRRADNGLEPHPHNGPIVTELFERRANGAGWAELQRWLKSKRARTQRGHADWSLRGVRDIVRSDVYLGVARHGEYVNREAHTPLTDPVTWRRAQRRGTVQKSRADEPALLGGLLRCAGCRYVMASRVVKLADGTLVRDFRCRCQAGTAHDCEAPAAVRSSSGIDDLVTEAFFAKVGELHAYAHANGGDLRALEAEATRARAALDEYAADSRVQAAIEMDAYVSGLEARRHAYEEAQRGLDEARDQSQPLPFGDDAGDLRARWPELSIAERRRLLALAFDCIFVRRGREPIAERLFACWRGEAPDLPSQGRRDFRPRPFAFEGPFDTGMPLAEDGEPARTDRLADVAA
jgi:site-specific DNA recombinase